MLLAACGLGFYGFLRAGEFTTLRPFDPSIHVAVSDVQAHTFGQWSSDASQLYICTPICSLTQPAGSCPNR